MAHAQKPEFVFRRNGRVHLNRQGRQFSLILAAEVCASVVAMLDTPSSEVVRRVLATHSIRQFPLHFPFRASPCVITFQLDSIWTCCRLCSDDVPGYGEDGSQSTPVTRSDEQEHDGKPHQHVPGRPYKSRGSTLIRGRLQHQESQGVERAVPQ